MQCTCIWRIFGVLLLIYSGSYFILYKLQSWQECKKKKKKFMCAFMCVCSVRMCTAASMCVRVTGLWGYLDKCSWRLVYHKSPYYIIPCECAPADSTETLKTAGMRTHMDRLTHARTHTHENVPSPPTDAPTDTHGKGTGAGWKSQLPPVSL